jgi:hypothetical protein
MGGYGGYGGPLPVSPLPLYVFWGQKGGIIPFAKYGLKILEKKSRKIFGKSEHLFYLCKKNMMDYCELPKEQLITKLPDFTFVNDDNLKINVVIAGGCIRDSLFGQEFNDIDIFGLTKDDLDLFIKMNLTKGHGYKLVYFNDNLRTYRKGKIKVQIIYREYEKLTDVIDSFDFTVCQFMYDGDKIICNPSSMMDVYHKRIVINHINPLFVLDTFRRTQKYIKKGYSICNGGVIAILDKCREITQEEYDMNVEFYPNTEERRISRFD